MNVPHKTIFHLSKLPKNSTMDACHYGNRSSCSCYCLSRTHVDEKGDGKITSVDYDARPALFGIIFIYHFFDERFLDMRDKRYEIPERVKTNTNKTDAKNNFIVYHDLTP